MIRIGMMHLMLKRLANPVKKLDERTESSNGIHSAGGCQSPQWDRYSA